MRSNLDMGFFLLLSCAILKTSFAFLIYIYIFPGDQLRIPLAGCALVDRAWRINVKCGVFMKLIFVISCAIAVFPPRRTPNSDNVQCFRYFEYGFFSLAPSTSIEDWRFKPHIAVHLAYRHLFVVRVWRLVGWAPISQSVMRTTPKNTHHSLHQLPSYLRAFASQVDATN